MLLNAFWAVDLFEVWDGILTVLFYEEEGVGKAGRGQISCILWEPPYLSLSSPQKFQEQREGRENKGFSYQRNGRTFKAIALPKMSLQFNQV